MKKFLSIVFFILIFTNAALAEDLRSQFLANKSVIYVINIRSFNSDDYNKNGIIDMEKGERQGTFLNAIGRLDELKAKGINTIHVLPVTKVGKKYAQGTAGSLYAMASFTQFDRLIDDQLNDYTTEEEAKIFIDECHKRDIAVIFDMPACGSYDLFEEHPELFAQDKDGKPITPLDWTDVRLFKTEENGQLYMPTYEAYQSYVDLLQSIGVDGIRADVATNKPYDFWVKLISHAREKNPNFLFLAEASEDWRDPIDKTASFTPYNKLLEAGFDGYLGSFFNLKNLKGFDLPTYVDTTLKSLKTYETPKTVIGGFSTHDEKSPMLIGGKDYAEQVLWFNATLPVDPYFVDGFDTQDRYLYHYGNRNAVETYTDCQKYFARPGQFDIFNLCAKPDGKSEAFAKEFKDALAFRQKHIDLITKGEFIPLKPVNKAIFAYAIKNGDEAILVIASKDSRYSQSSVIDLKPLKKFDKFTAIYPEGAEPPEIKKKHTTSLMLKAFGLKVFLLEK